MAEGVQSRIPFLREGLPVRRDVLYEPIKVGKFSFMDPFLITESKAENNKSLAETSRLRVSIGRPRKSSEETPKEYQLRLQIYGRLVGAALDDAVSAGNYGQADDASRKAHILKGIRAAQRITREEVKKLKGMPPEERLRILQGVADMVEKDPLRAFIESR